MSVQLAPRADLLIGDFAGGKTQLDRHPPLFFLFQPVGVAAGKALHQRGLSMVDVTGHAERDVDLFQAQASAGASLYDAVP